MSSVSSRRALRGLEALEPAPTGTRSLSPASVRDGSPAAQLLWSVPFPGVATMPRRPLLGTVLFLVGVAAPVGLVAWVYANRSDLIGIALDPTVLTVVVGLMLLLVIVRLAAIAEIASAFRRSPGIGGQTFVATVAVLALGAPVLWGAAQANEARGVVAEVFAGGSDEPVFPSTEAGQGDVRTILLLGGDAGPGRWGMRTDTMILVTVHEPSGRTALISVPRNLTRLRFPPGTPLAEEFPDGFDDLANALFTHVNGRPELVEYYGADGLQAEAVALSGAIGYSLGLEIDDFALVNMQGFTDVIDAVGGVTIEVAQEVPLPPSLPGERQLPGSVGPGVVDMDGALAIAFARSRSADSDYARMGRQRQLLAALGSQVSATDALRGFTAVTGTLDDSMRTSLTAGEFSDLLDRLGDNSSIGESVGLAPPIIEPGSPDFDSIRSIVDAVTLYVVTGAASGYAG